MGIGVGLGLAEFPFSGHAPFWRWVEACETGGVDSIWQSDRLVSREPFLETMSVMAALAGATERLKFGMNVASAGLRDPLLLAKQCATIDFLSGGRLLPAFGVGNPKSRDWTATGRDSAGSGAIADEALEIIARLWSGEAVTFEGKHFRYAGASISPTPVQKRIPMWIGGSSKAAIRRTGRLGTGWQAGFETPEQVAPVVAAIKEAAREAGRTIDEDHYGAGFSFRFGSWEDPIVAKRGEAMTKRTGRDPRKVFAVGDARDVLDRIHAYVGAGISKFILRPIGGDDAEMLDQTQRLIAEVLPEVEAMNRRAAAE